MAYERPYEVNGFYGLGTPDTIFVVPTPHGAWYCVEGGTNGNFTPDKHRLVDGVNIEELYDTDCFQTIGGIYTLEDFEREVEDV